VAMSGSLVSGRWGPIWPDADHPGMRDVIEPVLSLGAAERRADCEAATAVLSGRHRHIETLLIRRFAKVTECLPER
jgi:hypothetical protein